MRDCYHSPWYNVEFIRHESAHIKAWTKQCHVPKLDEPFLANEEHQQVDSGEQQPGENAVAEMGVSYQQMAEGRCAARTPARRLLPTKYHPATGARPGLSLSNTWAKSGPTNPPGAAWPQGLTQHFALLLLCKKQGAQGERTQCLPT